MAKEGERFLFVRVQYPMTMTKAAKERRGMMEALSQVIHDGFESKVGADPDDGNRNVMQAWEHQGVERLRECPLNTCVRPPFKNEYLRTRNLMLDSD